MDLTVTFLIEVAVIVVLLGVLAVAALLSLRRRQSQPDDRSHVPTPRPEPRREFFKSTGPGRNDEVKLRLYSPEEYGKELGGAADVGNMVGAVKAYQRLEDVWHELTPDQAANDLEMNRKDYEVDGEHGVLLLRKMPVGLPTGDL